MDSSPARPDPLVLVDNEGVTDPPLNLALEEWALRNLDPQYRYLLFYVNEPSIIIGRNQNTLEEINRAYVEEQDVQVVRRMSGGGAVYHDEGNLNFSFMTDYKPDRLHNFERFTRPLCRVLASMGVEARLEGRNDLVVGDGRKISGNAQFSTSRRMFSHGTLMFNTDRKALAQALNVTPDKIDSKAHQSVRKRVANIAEVGGRVYDVPTFRRRLIDGLFPQNDTPVYTLSRDEWDAVETLAETRYRRWEWTVGAAPSFDVRRRDRFDEGEVDVRMSIDDGKIDRIQIYGDFLGTWGTTAPLEHHLRGTPYDPEALRKKLAEVDVSPLLGGLSNDQFWDLLYARG
ncbi:MAG: lipoate--protein ligase [Salinibacter sp.]|jgi:lipoate-protein ligase (EC 6.-.-.-)|uniref:lipoate--protein ligase n=1 Tax=Salinibacter sp. TaxID=2065818 RepID=UPI002FC2EEFF